MGKKGKKSSKQLPVVHRLKTGITGLDDLLGGGLAEGRAMLVTGTSGTGKTVLLNEFLYRGIHEFSQGGVFITFEERSEDIVRNVAGLGWNYTELMEDGKFAMVDCSQQIVPVAKSGDFDFEVLMRRIENAIEKTSAKRVSIDSIGTAFGRYSQLAGDFKVRELLFTLMDRLKALEVTALISAEKTETEAALSRYGFEEFVSDGAMNLAVHEGQNKIIRTISVIKMRGLSFRSGRVEFEIGKSGMMIYPKIPMDSSVAKTDYGKREKTGIQNLDKAMGGGVPQGHMILVAGNTGTGKTLLGMQFLLQGFTEDKAGIWVALEEPVEQLKKTAAAHGWDLEAAEKQGMLHFIRTELLDISADQLLYRILRTAESTDAKRVVIDSVSSLESATMDRNKVREFLIQAATFFKSRGISCFMNYLSANTFGAARGQLLGSLTTNEMRLSSIVDGILLLRYVERDQRILKLMNIFKLRGSDHDQDILQYKITRGGIEIGKRFSETGGSPL